MNILSQPRWKEPEYTKKQINEAGNIVRNPNASPIEIQNARVIIDNWRAAHAYPLHVFYMNLRGKAGTRSDIIVAERLKRMESIIDKLQREPGMELYRMQDLGGCRMVLPTLGEVYAYSNRFQNSQIRHEARTPKDYIQNPKASGYRSLHLIYRFRTDTPDKEIYNQYPMLVELQFRTHLQHIWATAVESIGLFTNQALKAGKGDEAFKRFFVLVSSLFALRENCPIVPGTIQDEQKLVSEIKQINDQHHILDMLAAIRVVVEREVDSIPDKKGYYILQLNYRTRILHKLFFKPSEIEEASMAYDELESKRDDDPIDIVLVRASSFSVVKDAYPNYFLDIGEFINLIEEYLI